MIRFLSALMIFCMGIQGGSAFANLGPSKKPSRPVSAPLTIVIDPGHGGVDKGAQRGTIIESEIALNVAKKLAERLKEDARFRVILTRDRDVSLSLSERAAIANREKADLFVSIHANASHDPRAHGVEFWFQNQLPPDEESLFLANRENQNSSVLVTSQLPIGHDSKPSAQSDVISIIDDLKRNHRIFTSHDLSRTLLANWHHESRRKNKRAIRQAPFVVISEVQAPAVLVELGFISHHLEGPQLADRQHQKRVAENLYTGLVEFRDVLLRDRQSD